MSAAHPSASHDATLYGRSFADVYDEWYELADDADAAVAALRHRRPPPARVIEVGVGTGRLAVPLSIAGYDVTGCDTSVEMLERLAGRRAALSPAAAARLVARADDATELSTCADESADIVLLALNMVFNLVGEGDLDRCLAACARVAEPGAWLVVQHDIVDAAADGDPHRATSLTRLAGRDVRISTTLRRDGVIEGRHDELDGAGRPSGQPRRWAIRPVTPSQVDAAAGRAGWRLVDRTADWDIERRATDDDVRHVAWFRRG